MDNIIWKDIKGYECLYQVSNTGLVRSLKFGKDTLLKQQNKGAGYKKVYLYKQGSKRLYVYIHQLVAEAFIPNPNNLPLVRHKDDCPSNNHMDNLIWGTHNDNRNDCVKRGRQAKGEKVSMAVLTEQDVLDIRNIWEEGKINQIQIASMYGVKNTTISCIVNRHTWKHI